LHGAIFLYARLPSPMTSSGPEDSAAAASTEELLARLRDDQLWLLRQLDAGRWPEWRLDLAALERELDQLLSQLAEHSPNQDPA
jgi:hypothetical protein